MKTRIYLIAVLCISASGLNAACVPPILGDLDGNCRVDLLDLSILASNWLKETTLLPESTYYASPTGGGNGMTFETPFKIADFWQVAAPGDTLLLLDGQYTGPDSMVAPPVTLQGSEQARISIKAINDGAVTIDGQGNYEPVKLYRNTFFTLEGFNACNSSGSVVRIQRSGNTIVRRVCGWDARDGNTAIFWATQSDHVLFEDCAGWGIARKIFVNTYFGDYAIFRRCWGRWDGNHHIGPKMVYSTYYDSVGARFENCVGTWSAQAMQENYVLQDENQPDGIYRDGQGNMYNYTNYQVQNPHAIFGIDNQWHTADLALPKVLGCIAYTYPSERYTNYPLSRPYALFHGQPTTIEDTYYVADCYAHQHQHGQVAFVFNNVTAENIKSRLDNSQISGGTVEWGNPDLSLTLPLPIADRVLALTGHDINAYLVLGSSKVLYAAPGATGNGGYDNPMSIAQFMTVAEPGDTLVLKDGTYSGAEDMIAPPINLDGQTDSPITIKAENDGMAVIDGGGIYQPLYMNNADYWTLEGLVFRNSSGHVLEFRTCTNLTLFRLTASNAAGQNSVYRFYDCQNVTVDQCAGWGNGARVFQLARYENNITFTHCYARLDGCVGGTNINAISAGVQASSVTFDKCIAHGTVGTETTSALTLFACSAPDAIISNCVAVNDGPLNPSNLFRFQGTTNPPNCDATMTNCKAVSNNGSISQGYYLSKVSATNIQRVNCNIFQSNCCAVTEGSFNAGGIGSWPMRNRILAEAGTDVGILY